MCAIFGIVGKINFNLINKMSDVQLFRGPDKQSFFEDKEANIIMGNNRLSVIDAKNGDQPIHSENNRFVIVFNGTIYNYNEIKEYIEKNESIKFKTQSDTELIVNAYQVFGKNCFNFFDGMWAIAIFDKKKGELILSRDYLGQKPLFYEITKNRVLFSSQINGILQDKSLNRQLNINAIKKFHFLSGMRPDETIFKSIKQLKPGSIISIDTKNLDYEIKSYWDLQNGPDNNIFFKNNKNLDFFDEVINQHNISDIPSSMLLSSGIDSYLVANKFKDINPSLQTYTLGFKEKTFDETSKMTEGYERFNNNKFFLEKNEYIDNLKFILKNIDHPCGDTSILPTFSLIKKIHETKSVVGGDGGDEAFMGYIIFHALFFAQLFKNLPNFFNKKISNLLNILPNNNKYLSNTFKLKQFFKNINSNIFI